MGLRTIGLRRSLALHSRLQLRNAAHLSRNVLNLSPNEHNLNRKHAKLNHRVSLSRRTTQLRARQSHNSRRNLVRPHLRGRRSRNHNHGRQNPRARPLSLSPKSRRNRLTKSA
jgi:hypothetical protein